MNPTSRTAFILQIHKNPEQVNKFLKQLIVNDFADVYVHIDKRNFENLKGQIIKSPNVKVLKHSIMCEWGDISQVDTTILLFKEVLTSGKKYDFVCLRSGQDLLVKNDYKELLINNKGKIFMTHRNEVNKGLMEINFPKATRGRYTTFHPARMYRGFIQALYRKGFNLHPNPNRLPGNFTLYSGSQWFSVPYEVAEYIIEFLNENEWYYPYFKNTLVPDEWFFHTIIMNSPYKSHVVNNNHLFIKWGKQMSNRNSPIEIARNHIPVIEESDCFFARKFDETVDKSVIDYFATKVRFNAKQMDEKKENLIVI
ncbi:beta-1,6-N-acetylglucosaminyltransferase [Lederbergia panacisoli]|uniref:beta-1,6-N-acetylglucosaminyltransferase n=1 Tax=Lederbergia panacisoli TaxID=1255251 RepID=UPI00214AACFD|nr:beta-1,6-N-acetylglucosaminyltransferase [Lederbergia panacisoli]MCR2822005.1 beta-1,6-N-acetylglucosaminyltransferase [Lederbergia panacisoli]